jgi:hypothetical protein
MAALHIQRKGTKVLTVRDYFAAKAMQGWLAGYPAGIDHPARSEEGFIFGELSSFWLMKCC